MTVRVRRVREQRDPDDGARVLVDRLWPRGLAEADADHDRWLRDIAPSTELRRWFGHDPDRFAEFTRRYRAELHAEPAASALAELRATAAAGPLTLLTATPTPATPVCSPTWSTGQLARAGWT